MAKRKAKVTVSARQLRAYAAKSAKANAINDFITTNKPTFTQGCKFNAAWLDANLAWLVPNLSKKHHPIKQGLVRMTAYVTLNKGLAERGLYIASSNYYEDYTVLPLKDAEARVKTYYKTSTIQRRAGDCLDRNILAYKSKWRKLGSRQVTRLIAKL